MSCALPLAALITDRRLEEICRQRNARGSKFLLKPWSDAGGCERSQRAAFRRSSLFLEHEHILHAADVAFHSGDLRNVDQTPRAIIEPCHMEHERNRRRDLSADGFFLQ